MENPIGSRVVEILSFRQKNLTTLYNRILICHENVNHQYCLIGRFSMVTAVAAKSWQPGLGMILGTAAKSYQMMELFYCSCF